MARTPSTKTLALRTLNDAKAGSATRWAALMAARPYMTVEEYGLELRKLAATARAKVLRLCLLRLAELERDPADVELEEQLGALVGRTAPAETLNARPELDEELRRILTAPQPTAQGAPNAQPESRAEESLEPRPAGQRAAQHEVSKAAEKRPQSVQRSTPATATAERKPSTPVWLPVETANSFFDRMSAQRQEVLDSMSLEGAGTSFAHLQSASLAAERERKSKPKPRLYGMPSCGSELND